MAGSTFANSSVFALAVFQFVMTGRLIGVPNNGIWGLPNGGSISRYLMKPK
jgi:hypothetical protein